MELALSLGETPKPFPFLENTEKMVDKDGVFCMGLGPLINGRSQEEGEGQREEIRVEQERRGSSESDPRVQLNLLPFSPVPRNQVQVQVQRPSQLRFPWLTDKLLSEPVPSNRPGRELDVNCRQRLLLAAVEEREDGAAMSSPNSTASSFQMEMEMDLSIIYTSGSGSGSGRGKRDAETSLNEVDTDHQQRGARASSRTSDEEEENGLTRKKLRLSKDQSAFLEESFKEHNTLNPKQKLALAMQLNLCPRQVEVWFQNRRARTKLKQTEVDCEYLKKCCETLTEENKRLQKELQELRALKASQPFYMQLPATTLTMCPSCERVATTTTTTSSAAATTNNTKLALVKSRLYPLTTSQAHARQASS